MMDAVNWLLLKGGDAVQWLWGGFVTVLSGVWSFLVAVLNPVLSPILRVVNPITTAVSDVIYIAVSLLPVWLGLTLISVVFGLAMLFAFKHLSNQAAIVKVKDRIKANLLTLKLYKDELRVTFATQWHLLREIVRLQRYMLTPFLILLFPMVLVIAQMGLWYQWRPLLPGERAQIKMRLSEELESTQGAVLRSSDGLVIEAGPVPGGHEVYWRIRGGEPGTHTLSFEVNGATVEKELVVSDAFHRVNPKRTSARWVDQILYPAESVIPADSGVRSIEIIYPHVDSWIYGSDYWLVFFFVVSMAVALAAAPVFGVKY